MNKDDKELIQLKFKGVYEHQKANFDLVNVKLEQIYKQTLLTNGRVGGIEKQTRVVRFFENNPKITVLVILGILFLTSLFDAKDLINFFK